jgi:hypothetical protein
MWSRKKFMVDIDLLIRKLKRRRTIYVVLGCVLIALNLIVDLLNIIEGEIVRESQSAGYSIGYFIGSHFFLLFGLLLFYRVYKINLRIKELQNHQLNSTIDSIGNDIT